MKEDKAKEYELMVRKVFSQNVAKDWPIKNFKFSHRNRIKGIDSNLYEVDIAFEFEIADSKLLGIIECKNYSRAVGKNIVAEFSTKISWNCNKKVDKFLRPMLHFLNSSIEKKKVQIQQEFYNLKKNVIFFYYTILQYIQIQLLSLLVLY